ncbi:hypothetical protein [Paenibacillus antri]|uniref:hypothetical protein n=1 Tax=Paenibacillus antri TaxID=2582848 RepID=UPI0013053436|nr:hypothetical protein [Paenibacillus antri]
MTIRIIGMILYAALYLLACYAYFVAGSDWAAAASGAAALAFGASNAAKADVAGRGIGIGRRLFSIFLLLAAILGLFKVLPMAGMIMMQAAGLLFYAFEWRGIRAWSSRVAALALVVPAVLCFPVPGVHTVGPAEASDYSVDGKKGAISAPNVELRAALAVELFRQPWNRAEASDEASGSNGLGLAELSEEDFGDLYELPFEVPESFYAADGAATDPHALMKTLARWDATLSEDVTQGQSVMGIGSVAPDGSIGMVDDIEAYTQAALRSEPKVFFVPVEAYEQVRAIDKELLVVPVSRFEEVLYFLSQPVTFWPLRNFGLFCH